ncbi:hypothetical protein SAMN05421690_10311 [Nitrosomonas sp. Nm51]|nr:hypothetical protein SAMN05421690_10311 [Nitrosomonas sp. Nm51]
MCYVQFCLFFWTKGSVFCTAGHAGAYSDAKTTIILFKKQARRARHIFAPACSKRLNIAMAMLRILFTNSHQKSARANCT